MNVTPRFSSFVGCVLCSLLLMQGLAFGQWSSVPYRQNLENGDFEQFEPNKFRTRGLFGNRQYGRPEEPGKRELFVGSGVTRGPSGNFLGVDASAPNSMFKPLMQEEAAIARSAVPDNLQIPAAERIRSTAPWSSEQLPPAAIPADPSRVATGPGYVYPPAEWRPGESAGPREDIWMRAAPGQGPAGTPTPRADADALPMAGPATVAAPTQPDAWAMPNEAPAPQAVTQPPAPRYTAAQNQQIALRLARQVVATPGVRPQSPITVEYVDGVATIRGTVETTYGAQIAENTLSADPMVRQVRNQLYARAGAPRTPAPTTLPSAQPTPQR